MEARRCARDPLRGTRILGSSSRESPDAPQGAQVDPLEQHRELVGAPLDGRGVALHAREPERALLEAIVPERVSVAIPVQHLQPVAAARPEDEETPGEWTPPDHRTRQLGEFKALVNADGAVSFTAGEVEPPPLASRCEDSALSVSR